MIKIILKNNKKGFVLLFAVTLAALLLAIALGVSNIAAKELRFSINAQSTNDAFFAADSGAEYMLFKDKGGNPPTCTVASPCILGGLGSLGKSCFKVTIDKSSGTKIVSKGYNIGSGGSSPNWTCNSTLPNAVERELKITY